MSLGKPFAPSLPGLTFVVTGTSTTLATPAATFGDTVLITNITPVSNTTNPSNEAFIAFVNTSNSTVVAMGSTNSATDGPTSSLTGGQSAGISIPPQQTILLNYDQNLPLMAAVTAANTCLLRVFFGWGTTTR